jgi:hypothetical protein
MLKVNFAGRFAPPHNELIVSPLKTGKRDKIKWGWGGRGSERYYI